MQCRAVKVGEVTAIVCGKFKEAAKCRWCGRPSTKLCDYPLSSRGELADGKTCDAPMCDAHARNAGPNKDLCPEHAKSAAAASRAPLHWPATIEALQAAGYVDHNKSKWCSCGTIMFWFSTPTTIFVLN